MSKTGAVPNNNTGTAGDTLVFHGSNSLWISLTIFAILTIPATLWVGSGARSLLIGAGVSILFALGAWFSWRQRREVVIDDSGITIRAGDGTVKAQIPWPDLTRIEERRIPSQPLQSALLLHRVDGSALLIDPQQVRDTGTMVREIRRHRNYTGSSAPERRSRR